MLLSEAIRRGSKMKPQGYGALFSIMEHAYAKYGAQIRSCALGAAADALREITELDLANHHKGILLEEFFFKRFPILEMKTQHPLAGTEGTSKNVNVKSIIIHLNDGLKWTREEIADWVETVENRAREISEIEKAVNSPNNLIHEHTYAYTS